MAKKKSTKHVPTRTPSRRLLDGLEQADTLMRRKAWPQAREALAALDRNYPREPEVLGRLVNVNYALNDMLGYQSAAERLLAVDPGAHDLRPALASAYLRNGLPTLALRSLREFLRLAPNHPKAGDARGMLADLERGMPALLAELGAAGDAGLKLAELHEEVQSYLNQGEYARARQAALGVLRQKPDIAPVLNNLTQAYAADGYLSEALATTERVLAFDPRNVHALSNRARILALLGRFDEGREAAHRMLASGAAAVDGWMKKAEALSYLAMDAEMLALFEGARLAEGSEQGLHDGVLWHLAAVAALNLRRENDARTWWQEALKRERGLTLATDNLNDLQKPVGQRNGSWAYDLRYWLSETIVHELQREFGSGRKSEAAEGPARRFLSKHPEMGALVPAWLDRGAPDMREFALMLVEAAATPELIAAAKDFALGQRGSDAQRMKAAQLAVQHGALPAGRVQFWGDGQWREVILMGIEIHGDAVRDRPHRPQVERLLYRALEQMHADRMAPAEALLKQALALEPDAPDLLNNLAATYATRGRQAEAEAIWQAIFDKDPDYLFARVSLARAAALRGDTAKARELLDPLLVRRRMHFSEFAAVAGAQIDTALADGKPEEARSWLQMWEKAMPDDPRVEHYRGEIRRQSRGRPQISV